MNPEFEDEKAVNPFDFWDGANFKMKIRNVEGYRNYDKSEFADPSPLFGGDDSKIEELWKKEHSLKDCIDPSKFKKYDELKGRLDKVLGGVAVKTVAENANLELFLHAENTVNDAIKTMLFLRFDPLLIVFMFSCEFKVQYLSSRKDAIRRIICKVYF